jgi:hypothetical protein
MDIWTITQAEFIGPAPAGGHPSYTMNDWSTSGHLLLAQMPPNHSARVPLTGCNSAYFLTPVLGLPHQFIAWLNSEPTPQAVGLYDDTLIVLDPNHTGHWLAEELVVAAWSVRSYVPNTPRQLTTASEKTFKRAHELAVRRAHARLAVVHSANLTQYGLPRWP